MIFKNGEQINSTLFLAFFDQICSSCLITFRTLFVFCNFVCIVFRMLQASLLHRKCHSNCFDCRIDPIHCNSTACHACDRSLLSMFAQSFVSAPSFMQSYSVSRNMQPSAPNNRLIHCYSASVLFSICSSSSNNAL